METMTISVLIPAAGVSSRYSTSENKLFAKIKDKTVLERTVLAFDCHKNICQTVIVAGKSNFNEVKDFLYNLNLKKPCKVVLGGDSRQDSVRLGLKEVTGTHVLIHDGARPLVTCKIIDDCIKAFSEYDACVVSVPVTDTVKRCSSDGLSVETVNRSSLFAAQTPQGFKTSLIKDAHERAFKEGFAATDDASIMEWLGIPVKIIMGDYKNIKITHKEDIIFAEAFAEGNKNMYNKAMIIRTGMGYDVHKFSETPFERKLILGGVHVPYDFGLLGHSDADVVTHAVMDALLGAGALGDIGVHFPPSDNSFKDINSLLLLEKVKEILDNAGFSVLNIDCVIMAEAPKLSPHTLEMRKNIAHVLNIDVNSVGIKATTCEGLGFVGRKEGIAAQCTCLVQGKAGF